MRHASIPLAAATTIFILGVFIINLQVWYSARADSLAGANYVVRNMTVILKRRIMPARWRCSLLNMSVMWKSSIG
jgi:hypothetical protein